MIKIEKLDKEEYIKICMMVYMPEFEIYYDYVEDNKANIIYTGAIKNIPDDFKSGMYSCNYRSIVILGTNLECYNVICYGDKEVSKKLHELSQELTTDEIIQYLMINQL